MSICSRVAGAAFATWAVSAGPALSADAPGAHPGEEFVHACWPVDETGLLTGTRVAMPIEPAVAALLARDSRNPADNRLDLVIVGDGYTAGQLALFDLHADAVMSNFFRYEPFTAYEPYFRVTKVDVVSIDSGVDNDPSQGINRNTALDMTYWCANIERLLCVNVSKAYNFANQAPFGVDQVLAIANSSKYGGAGYPSSNLGTVAGANSASVDVAIHEMGHSLGDLADEYDYGGSTTYSGGEPPDANASLLNASQLVAQQRKWWRWIGVSDSRLDNPVGAYEGAVYSQFGVYRPSPNSMMRNLFRRFNGPSAEALIAAIYQEVSPIDAVSPADAAFTLTPGPADAFFVTPMRPVGHTLDISWSVNGQPVPALDGQESVSADALGLGSFAGAGSPVAVTVTVVDPTTMVRNEALRDALMTDSFSWQVSVQAPGPCDALDLTGDGAINFADVQAFLSLFADPACQ